MNEYLRPGKLITPDPELDRAAAALERLSGEAGAAYLEELRGTDQPLLQILMLATQKFRRLSEIPTEDLKRIFNL